MSTRKLHAPEYVEPLHQGICADLTGKHAQISLLHSHDYHEVFLVIEGTANHMVNGKESQLQKGSLVLLRPEDEHAFEQPISDDFRFYNIILIESLLDNAREYLSGTLTNMLRAQLPMQELLSHHQFEMLKSTMKKLTAYPKADHQRFNTALRLCFMEILSIIFYSYSMSDEPTVPNWLSTLINEMHEPVNYREGIPAMQRLANCSKEHLSRTFKKYYNVSPTVFINNIRLEEAAVRIIYTPDPIIAISEDLGFGNLSHFYHLFKDKYGVTPKQYRENSRRS